MKCTICKKNLNTKKENYGWHINKEGHIEKCSFQNMSMQYITKPIKIKRGKNAN